VSHAATETACGFNRLAPSIAVADHVFGYGTVAADPPVHEPPDRRQVPVVKYLQGNMVTHPQRLNQLVIALQIFCAPGLSHKLASVLSPFIFAVVAQITQKKDINPLLAGEHLESTVTTGLQTRTPQNCLRLGNSGYADTSSVIRGAAGVDGGDAWVIPGTARPMAAASRLGGMLV
jgi:hypothetical protein